MKFVAAFISHLYLDNTDCHLMFLVLAFPVSNRLFCVLSILPKKLETERFSSLLEKRATFYWNPLDFLLQFSKIKDDQSSFLIVMFIRKPNS